MEVIFTPFEWAIGHCGHCLVFLRVLVLLRRCHWLEFESLIEKMVMRRFLLSLISFPFFLELGRLCVVYSLPYSKISNAVAYLLGALFSPSNNVVSGDMLGHSIPVCI